MIRPSLFPSRGFPFPRCVFIPSTPWKAHCLSWTRDFNDIPAPFLACSTSPSNTWRAKKQERPEKRAKELICVVARMHHSQKWLRVEALSVQDQCPLKSTGMATAPCAEQCRHSFLGCLHFLVYCPFSPSGFKVTLRNSGDPITGKHPTVARNIKAENRTRISASHLLFPSTTKHFLQ